MSVADWLDMMTQTVSIAAASTMSGYGERTYGTAVSYACRIAGKRRLVLNAQGQEVVSSMTVYLGSPVAVDPTARITLSTADAGSTSEDAIHPAILASGRYPDENGAHHTELYL